MSPDFTKWPRLYIEHDLKSDETLFLCPDHAHYLYNVLRMREGQSVRLFNGRDGEWQGRIDGASKKQIALTLVKELRTQPDTKQRIHFFFAPIKQARMDWMLEKAVELGVTDFHPILTQNTDVRKINEKRLNKQMVEASEQCERYTIPVLNDIVEMKVAVQKYNNLKLLACLERHEDAPLIHHCIAGKQDTGLIIGPVGGLTVEETTFLAQHCTPVSLGPNILRCETAAIMALGVIGLNSFS